MHCFNACSLSCSLLHCLCSIISIFLMVTNCQWVKLWNHQYVESPAFIFVHSRVTMGDSFLNTVARISTCGQQLWKRHLNGCISPQGRWSLHAAISECVAWQKTEKRNVVFSFVEKLENLQQPEITQLDLFVLCYDDRPGIKRSPDNLKQVNSPLYFWFVRPQPPASGWSADWGTAGSPAAAAVQHHWEENT